MFTDSKINLTFHGIGMASRPLEEGEESVWISEELFTDILKLVVVHPYSRVTFDDGNISDLYIGIPQLLKHNLDAIFFVLPGKIGAPGFLDSSQIKDISDAGMTIGVHGWDHRSWRKQEPDDLERELTYSKKLLEDLIQKPIHLASCPFGEYDSITLRELARRGYKTVYTSDRLPTKTDQWLQPRYTIHKYDTIENVKIYLQMKRFTIDRFVRLAKVFIKKRR